MRRQASGMQAAVNMLGCSACLHGDTVAPDAAAHARSAAVLLVAVLEAAPQPASQAFFTENGFLTVRMCITCAQLGGSTELKVCPLLCRVLD